jgi:hypothetical protein
MWQISVLGIDADLDRYCVFVRVLLDKVCGPLVCEDDREVGEIRVRGAADELGCREEAASAMKSLKRRNILDRNFGGDLDEIFFLAMREKSMPRRYRQTSLYLGHILDKQALRSLEDMHAHRFRRRNGKDI